MKKILLCTALMSIMLFAGGCGRRTVTMPTADEDTGTGTEQAAGRGGTLAEQLGAEESWEEDLALDGKEVNAAEIRAAISVPDTDHMSVLTMKADDFTGEKKKALLEAVCDADSIYVFEEDVWPDWYAKQEVDRANNEVAAMHREKEEHPDDFDEETLRTMQEYLAECKEKEKNAVTQGKVSGDYSEDTYYGVCDGRNIMFHFREGWASWNIEENPSSLTMKEGLSDSAHISYYKAKYETSENLCTMPEEQAVQTAESFIEGIGYSGYGVFAINPLSWTVYGEDGEAEGSWIDGYSIMFTRNVDGILQEVGAFPIYANGDIDIVSRYGLEEIEVSINDMGILDAHIGYPYSVEEVSASATPLLSYEQVQGIFLEILQKEPDQLSFYGERLNFNSMDLIYFRVADTEGDTYALLPVWILSNKTEDPYIGGHIVYNCALMINAIDGSQIDYMGELYELTEE